MAEINDDAVGGSIPAPRKMGFFESLVVRLVRPPAPGSTEPSSAFEAKAAATGAPARSARAGGDPAWSEALAWIDRLGAQTAPIYLGAPDVAAHDKAVALWGKLARKEIAALRLDVASAASAGWEGALALPALLVEAAQNKGLGVSAPKDAALLFGLGWEERAPQPPAGEAAIGSRWRASGVDEYGSEAPETLAALAAATRCAREVCSMAQGQLPIAAYDMNSGGRWSEMNRLASNSGVWARHVETKNFMDRKSFHGAVAVGEPVLPSLPMLCERFGELPIQAMAHGGHEASAEILSVFVRQWEASTGMGPAKKGIASWALPSPARGLASAPILASSGAPSNVEPPAMEEWTPMQRAARACAVPDWSLGKAPIPPESWLAEKVESRLANAPVGYWGAEGEDARAKWLASATAERSSIHEDSRSASYSDDPSCRRSESDACSRAYCVIDAQEALLDWAMRKDLPPDSPWSARVEDGLAALAALGKLEAFQDMRNGAGAYSELARGARLGAEAKDPKQLADLVKAWAQAREIEAAVEKGSGEPGKPMRI